MSKYRFDITYMSRPIGSEGKMNTDDYVLYSDKASLEVKEVCTLVSKAIQDVDHLLVIGVNGKQTAGCLKDQDECYFLGRAGLSEHQWNHLVQQEGGE
jgi:hypothetical protein